MFFEIDRYNNSINQELWIIVLLILIILLNVFSGMKKKIIIVVSILFLIPTSIRLYVASYPVFLKDFRLDFYLEYPFGIVLLFFTILLIISAFYKNKLIMIICVTLLLISITMQINLRFSANHLEKVVSAIRSGNESQYLSEIVKDTIDEKRISNKFGFENTFLSQRVEFKRIYFAPFLKLKEDQFGYFRYPNYYWTSYEAYSRKEIIVELGEEFVPPQVQEFIKLRSINTIREFFIIMSISENGEINDYMVLPDSMRFYNLEEYLDSIKITPAFYFNEPVAIRFTKRYAQKI